MNAPLVEKPTATSLMIRRVFDADQPTLWRALTDPNAWMEWFGAGYATPTKTEADVRPGGAWRIEMRGNDSGNEIVLFGNYVDVDEPNSVSFTWAWAAAPERGDSLVTYKLSPADEAGKTSLLLTHERLPDTDIRDSHAMGWTGTMELLAKYLS